jgi:hypothetical protein
MAEPMRVPFLLLGSDCVKCGLLLCGKLVRLSLSYRNVEVKGGNVVVMCSYKTPTRGGAYLGSFFF